MKFEDLKVGRHYTVQNRKFPRWQIIDINTEYKYIRYQYIEYLGDTREEITTCLWSPLYEAWLPVEATNYPKQLLK